MLQRLETGRYCIARVYDGENWNPGLKAPRAQPGVMFWRQFKADPSAVRQGHDPQLEKAVQVVMKELEESQPVQPAYPNYHPKLSH